MKRIHKILSTKLSFALVVLLILLILSLNSWKDLLHNHPPDIFEYDDCPVLILNQVLSSGIIVHFEVPIEHSVEFNFAKPQKLSLSKLHIEDVNLRSPPLV